jgi:heme A synthase
MNGVLFSWNQYFRIKSEKWRNLFENNFSVQFNHRIFAYLTYSLSAYIFYMSLNSGLLP